MNGIPTVFYWQVFNFAIFVALLFFLLRKKVVAHFAEREANFRQALLVAEHARNEAENQRRKIQEKLQTLESSAAADLARARHEAEELKAKILLEAKELVSTMQVETERTAKAELAKAKAELREEVVVEAIAQASKLLKERMNEPDQKRLQNEFVEKIQAVRT